VANSDYDKIIELIGILVHMREPYDDHGAHVAALVVKMAAAMNIPPDEAEQMRIGAHIHDIGKLLLDPDLINMPRRLASSERAEMQNHTNLGWAAVARAGYSQIVQDIVHHHQEKWDGSGYPIGLQDELIPLAARIVGICDVYAALTYRRPYRDPYSHEEAKAVMRLLRGKDFDPRLLDLFFADVAIESVVQVAE
jgi:putative nucleotidyltransferase with HDIG domain